MAEDKRCYDCGVLPGELHVEGCDVERCPFCGGQAISCGCDDETWSTRRMPWTGEWPGKTACRELGLWCRDLDRKTLAPIDGVAARMEGAEASDILWHQPCREDDPGAHEDLNRLYSSAMWDSATQTWVAR